jgi:hypothetical protein
VDGNMGLLDKLESARLIGTMQVPEVCGMCVSGGIFYLFRPARYLFPFSVTLCFSLYYNVRGGSLHLAKAIPVGKQPGEMCLDPGGKHIFVSNIAEKNIAMIDLDSKTVVANFTDVGNEVSRWLCSKSGFEEVVLDRSGSERCFRLFYRLQAVGEKGSCRHGAPSWDIFSRWN